MKTLYSSIGLMLLLLTPARGLGNDDCSDYIDLTGIPLPLTVAGSTEGMANDYGPFPSSPDCWPPFWYPWSPSSGMGVDATYKWTVPATGRYTFSLCNSPYPHSTLLLYDFTCPTEPVYPDDFICGRDGLCETAGNAVLWMLELSAGQEVLVVVDGTSASGGPYELTISDMSSDPDVAIQTIMDIYHLPGLAACGIVGDEVAWSGTYGDAHIELGRAVTDTTSFVAINISKTIVAIAAMQLWEQGLIGLDNDINDYIPFEVHNPWHPDSPITLRMLLSYSSSLLTYNGEIYIGRDPEIPLGVFLEDCLTPGGANYSLGHFNSSPPGTRCIYGDLGSALAAYAVEVISTPPIADEWTFDDYCRQNIFEPLGMSETSYFFANLDTTNCAMPYTCTQSGCDAYGMWSLAVYPSRGLWSSPLRLSRLLAAFKQGGVLDNVRILESATVDTMLSDYCWDPRHGTAGLGWYYNSYWPDPDRATWWITGRFGSSAASWSFNPDDDTGIVFAVNDWMPDEAYSIIGTVIYDHLRSTTSVVEPPVALEQPKPEALALAQNRPNPFNPTTTIAFETSQRAHIRLRIFDPAGRLVRSLIDESLNAGAHTVDWDGRDDGDAALGSGVYFYQLQVSDKTLTRKLVLLQ